MKRACSPAFLKAAPEMLLLAGRAQETAGCAYRLTVEAVGTARAAARGVARAATDAMATD